MNKAKRPTVADGIIREIETGIFLEELADLDLTATAQRLYQAWSFASWATNSGWDARLLERFPRPDQAELTRLKQEVLNQRGITL